MRYLIFVMLIVLAHQQAMAQHARYKPLTPAVPGKNLVVEIPQINDGSNLMELKKKFSNFPGVRFTGFCEKRKWIFLKVTEDEFFNALIAIKELNLVYYLRQDISFSDAMKKCENYQPVELSSTN